MRKILFISCLLAGGLCAFAGDNNTIVSCNHSKADQKYYAATTTESIGVSTVNYTVYADVNDCWYDFYCPQQDIQRYITVAQNPVIVITASAHSPPANDQKQLVSK